ncbi:hypothetical protein [Xanthomonas arboricola]|uniref:hypothetical protein n=1 Tax=Xanthomonas arboricola TaxID=56448 RepID=UPI0011B0A625|nr:hypothetical protein [Xanthomonas arboricola]
MEKLVLVAGLCLVAESLQLLQKRSRQGSDMMGISRHIGVDQSEELPVQSVALLPGRKVDYLSVSHEVSLLIL